MNGNAVFVVQGVGIVLGDLLLAALCLLTLLSFIYAALTRRAARHMAAQTLTPWQAMDLLRREGDAIRAAGEGQSATARQDVGHTLSQFDAATTSSVSAMSAEIGGRVDAFGERLETSNRTTEARIEGIGAKLNADLGLVREGAVAHSESLRGLVEGKLDDVAGKQSAAARELRADLEASFARMRQAVSDTLREASETQKERLSQTQLALATLTEQHLQSGERLREIVEGRLDALRQENAAKLEEVRQTVDEKLQTTLETRLKESFNNVVEQLNRAYEVFGEMRTISSNVGDLKNVLTNPKLRGTFGEVQVAMLLQDFLSPGQFIKDAQVKENSGERVEFAIRLPLHDGDEMLLPVDAKFPREDHENMIKALETGDAALADHFRKQLENRIKAFAKDIARKYINPPRTTERAILFLPTESLFAEVLRQPGLFDYVQRECNVMLAGPTTFAAILHAFQVNHRSVAIAKQSSEVWKVLGAVKTEFRRYNEVVGKVAKQINTVSGTVSELGLRTRQMDKALTRVETLPDDGSAQRMLGVPLAAFGTPDDGDGEDGDDDILRDAAE